MNSRPRPLSAALLVCAIAALSAPTAATAVSGPLDPLVGSLPVDEAVDPLLGLLPVDEAVDPLLGLLPVDEALDPLLATEPLLDGVDTSSTEDSLVSAPAPPQVGELLNAAPHIGRVRVKLPGKGWLKLPQAASIPFGTLIDATRGSVTLTSARDASGATQSATFAGAAFMVGQQRAAKPVTELTLRGGNFRPCWRSTGARRSSTAKISARRRPIRRLWGSGKGRFRTRGRYGAATVRGTIWLTEDTCAGTRVSVRRGKVAVSSFRTGRTVLVRAGRTHLAPSRRPSKRSR